MEPVEGHFVLAKTGHFVALFARVGDLLDVVDLDDSGLGSIGEFLALTWLVIDVVKIELWDPFANLFQML